VTGQLKLNVRWIVEVGGKVLWRKLQYDEYVLLKRLRVWQAFEDAGQRIRQQERERQFDCRGKQKAR
jgi:hypothetical protein